MITVGEYSFAAIGKDAVAAVWPQYGHFIAASVQSDSMLISAEELRLAAEMGAYQLWCVEHLGSPVGAFMTTARNLPRGRQLDVEFLGGDSFFEWGPRLWPYFERNAKCQGISKIRLCGRPGWARVFRAFEYSPDIVIASKVL